MDDSTNLNSVSGSFSKTRLEAFSDGVFAIAITLLVLDIAVKPGGSPLEELWSAWPTYVGYVVSFLTIGVAWIGHSAMTEKLTRADSIYLRINLVFLLVVVFLPFATKLVTEAFGDREAERVAATVYGLTLLLIRLLGIALDKYAKREALYATVGDDEELDNSRRYNIHALVGYLISIIIGLLLPAIAVAAYFAVALYLVIPFREIALLRSKSPR
jgi:uncharacterized membrane protein